MISPLRYTPAVETIEPDESRTIAELSDVLRSIADTTFKDTGKALRSVHAKTHGLIESELEVLSGLPPTLAQGIFAKPGRYPAFMRLSTIPGDLLDDSVSLPRGMGLKIVGVPGARLPGSEGDTTQDFVLVNGPAFIAPNAKAFLKNLKLLAKTTDTAEGAKKVLSAALRGAESLLEKFGGESPMLKTLGGHPETHILGETFYSQAALRFGDYIAKIAVAPVSPELTALTGKHVDLDGRPNGLSDAVKDFFRVHDAAWEIRAQLCTNLEDMPVEDASKIWPEDKSAYVAVARLTAKTQEAGSPEKVRAIDDGMAFSPWHGTTDHQPLGSVMRARKDTYEMSANLRSQRSGCPIREPARRS